MYHWICMKVYIANEKNLSIHSKKISFRDLCIDENYHCLNLIIIMQ